MSTASSAERDERYSKTKAERQKHVEAILASSATKKVVVAGPGTGKTHLFQEVLKGKDKTLTLTFVNALVEDLSLELCGLSDVRTLHSFARGALAAASSKGKVKIFPKLVEVIKEDARRLLGKDVEFERLFHDRQDESEYIAFYKTRKDYYRHYGYSDVVFALVKYFEAKKDRTPSYEQIVVDEFQDFNKLEVSLIELLAEKSPVLIAGDDDQALYDFKHASPEHIRQRYGGPDSGYSPFTLPYCSRCTRVIVDAVNDILSVAVRKGYLGGRVNKSFRYFENEEKDRDSEHNPRIVHAQVFAKQVPWFIETEIEGIAKDLRKPFSVLVISPTSLQSRITAGRLRSKGFKNVQFAEKEEAAQATYLDGLRLLLEDVSCNLGWRIVLPFISDEETLGSLLQETHKDGAKALCDLIPADRKKEVRKILQVLRAVRDEKEIPKGVLESVLEKIGFDTSALVKDAVKEELASSSGRAGNPGVRKIPIKVTTIQSSKGLSADYVFLTYFDDRYFIKAKSKTDISDRDICNFLVTLTRARRKAYLVSTERGKTPTFLTWIDERRIEAL